VRFKLSSPPSASINSFIALEVSGCAKRRRRRRRRTSLMAATSLCHSNACVTIKPREKLVN